MGGATTGRCTIVTQGEVGASAVRRVAHDVGTEDEFEHGVPRIVRVAGREVVVVKWDDEFFALRNVCPHQSQSFINGLVCWDVTAPGPDGDLALTEPVIVCPWHCWPYELRTGRCTVDPLKRVRAFGVAVEEGRVIVSV